MTQISLLHTRDWLIDNDFFQFAAVFNSLAKSVERKASTVSSRCVWRFSPSPALRYCWVFAVTTNGHCCFEQRNDERNRFAWKFASARCFDFHLFGRNLRAYLDSVAAVLAPRFSLTMQQLSSPKMQDQNSQYAPFCVPVHSKAGHVFSKPSVYYSSNDSEFPPRVSTSFRWWVTSLIMSGKRVYH